MTTFYEREQAFEAKFVHDEEFRFLMTARRDKLFAHWAALQLHSSAQATADLTKSILAVPDGNEHDKLLLKHVAKLFLKDADSALEAKLEVALNNCAVEARQQLLNRLPN